MTGQLGELPERVLRETLPEPPGAAPSFKIFPLYGGKPRSSKSTGASPFAIAAFVLT